ncbi:hypothetical protein [Streptomyces sp. NPDC002187]|uniref:hypothetical protein n=1 Tax=Streptomyces sp. NPDC002187 TaxID=3364637 RepID=UPI0036A7D2F6
MAAVVASAVTGAVGVVGAVCAYAAGKAQAKGVVAGVRLQLDGQRTERLWEADRQASASYLAILNSFRHQAAHAEALFGVPEDQVEVIAPGEDRNHALIKMTQLLSEAYLHETLLKFHISDGAEVDLDPVRNAMGSLYFAVGGYCRERHAGRDGAQEETLTLECSDAFSRAVNAFAESEQRRFSKWPDGR